MVFQRKKVASALGLVLGVGSVGAGIAPALAQDIRVDVTGSNIRRVEGEGALPVHGHHARGDRPHRRADGRRAAAVRLVEQQRRRDLGDQRHRRRRRTACRPPRCAASAGQNTLVLLNGKRLTAASGEIQGVYGVNLDSIPFSAIERVEVLKDGASAVYGTDAIGGVINFILRQDFRGAEATVYYGAPTRGGGGEKWNATGTVGFGDLAKDRYNVFCRAYYQKAKSLDQNKRNFSDDSVDLDQGLLGISGNTFPAHITTGGIGTPGFPNCAPSIYVPTLDRSSARPLLLRPGGRRRRQRDSRTGDLEPVRLRPLAVQPELAGSTARPRTRRTRRATSSSRRRSRTSSPTARTRNSPPTSCCRRPARSTRPRSRRPPASAASRSTCATAPTSSASATRPTPTRAGRGVAGLKGTAWNWDFDFDFVYSRNETTLAGPNGGFPRYSHIAAAAQLRAWSTSSAPNTPEVQAEIDATQFREETFNGASRPATCSTARRPASSSSCRRAASRWPSASRPARRSSSRRSIRRCSSATSPASAATS